MENTIKNLVAGLGFVPTNPSSQTTEMSSQFSEIIQEHFVLSSIQTDVPSSTIPIIQDKEGLSIAVEPKVSTSFLSEEVENLTSRVDQEAFVSSTIPTIQDKERPSAAIAPEGGNGFLSQEGENITSRVDQETFTPTTIPLDVNEKELKSDQEQKLILRDHLYIPQIIRKTFSVAQKETNSALGEENKSLSVEALEKPVLENASSVEEREKNDSFQEEILAFSGIILKEPQTKASSLKVEKETAYSKELNAETNILKNNLFQKSDLINQLPQELSQKIDLFSSTPLLQAQFTQEGNLELNPHFMAMTATESEALIPSYSETISHLPVNQKTDSFANVVVNTPQPLRTVETQDGIRFHITSLQEKEGIQQIRVALTPDHLGNIKIELSTNTATQQTEAHFTFSEQEGFDLFQGNRQELIGLLQKAGLDLNEDQIRFELTHSGEFLDQSQRERGQDNSNNKSFKSSTQEEALSDALLEQEEISTNRQTLLYVEA